MSDMRDIFETVNKHGERAGMCIMLRLWADSLTDTISTMAGRTKVETSAALRADWEAAKQLMEGRPIPSLPDTTHPGWDRLEADIANAEPVTVGYDAGSADHHGDDLYQSDK
jgi:hypothetical protein